MSRRRPTEIEMRLSMLLRKRRAQRCEGGMILTQYDIDDVRALLRALAEPTKEMTAAGNDELDHCQESDWSSNLDGDRIEYTRIDPDAPGRIFKAMIDAASPPEEEK